MYFGFYNTINMKKNIIYFIKDKNKKPYLQIVKEVFQLFIKDKKIPKHYFSRAFYHENDSFDYRNFMSMNTYFTILNSKNFKNPILESILHNKLLFDIFCNKNNIPTATVISYNFDKNIYFNDEVFNIDNSKKLKIYFLNIFKQKKITKLFLKPIQGEQGNGMFLINIDTSLEEYQEIFNEMILTPYLHQEFIEQHDKVNEIFSKTINTIRLETYIDNKGNIHFLGVYMRFGFGNSIVDNVSAGGLFVPIDIETGRLFDYGYMSKYNFYDKCTEHPDTKVKFKGFNIPDFESVKEVVISATKKLPRRIIGWDIAITLEGPIIIEGNYYPGILQGEYSYNGYKNRSIFKEIIEEATK